MPLRPMGKSSADGDEHGGWRSAAGSVLVCGVCVSALGPNRLLWTWPGASPTSTIMGIGNEPLMRGV